MNQLEERKYYEEDDEIDLMELIRSLMKHKYLIVISTLIVTVLVTLGGYVYNKINTVNSAIIKFNYPEIATGKNPDGSIFLKENIIPLNVLNTVFEEEREKIKSENIAVFKKNVEIQGIIPNGTETRIENALKKGEDIFYVPTQYKISSKEDKKVLAALVTDVVEEFINKYKPNYTLAPFENIQGYDYDNIYLLINDRIDLLKANLKNGNKENYISNKLGYSFNELAVRIDSLQRVELQDYYSYYNVNGLSLNKIMRGIRYDSEIKENQLEKEKLMGKAQILKNLLDQYKPTGRQIVVPNIGDFGVKIDTENEYYSNLINQYLSINNQIKDKEFEIKKLQEEKDNINYPSENQKNVIEQKLNLTIEKLNNIIEDLNKINEDYVNAKYSDMIKVISPVTQINEGKPLPLFLGVGIVLGGMLGVFLAFMREFAKNYKNKYSK